MGIAALLLLGCGPYYGVTETTFMVRQSAVLPTPSAPMAAGPPVARNRVALEGSFAYDASNTGSATRVQHGGAQYALNTRGSMLALFNISDRIELGPSFEWSFGGLVPASPDLQPRENFNFWRGGLVLRVPFVRGHPWVVGANLELFMMAVSATRQIDRVDRRTSYSDCTGTWVSNSCVRTVSPGSTTTTTGTASGESVGLEGVMRFGLYGGGRVGSRVAILGGMSVQTQPDVVGYQVTTSVCDTRETGYADHCTDPVIAGSLTRVVGTPWLSVGVDLGRVTLFANGYVNALGPASIVQRSPGGASLSTRINF